VKGSLTVSTFGSSRIRVTVFSIALAAPGFERVPSVDSSTTVASTPARAGV